MIDNIFVKLLIYFLQFDDNFTPCDIWTTSVTSITLYLHLLKSFSSIIIELKQQNCVTENQILEAISYIKNVSWKSPTAENILNYISKTSASNIDLSFVNKTINELTAENKINDNFEIIEKPKNGDLIQSIHEAQSLVDDWTGLEPHYTSIGRWKRIRNTSNSHHTHLKKTQACNFIKKETLAQVFSCESCEISKNIFFLRTPLVAASYDTCALNEDFNSYQVKCIKELQNVKDAFLKKLSDTEQNLERNFKEKEYAGASLLGGLGGLDFVVTRRSGIFWQNFFY